MKFFLVFAVLIFYNPGFATSCKGILNSTSYTYLNKGHTGLVYSKGTTVFKVPYSSEAAQYALKDGLSVVSHEKQLLDAFHVLIEEAGVTEFRPLSHSKATPLQSPSLRSAVDKELNERGIKPSIEVNGVLESEKITGPTLYELLIDPNVSLRKKRTHMRAYHKALLKIQEHLENSPRAAKDSKVTGANRVTYDENNSIYIGNSTIVLYDLYIDLSPSSETLQSDFSLYISVSKNIIVETDGTLVLIDPN